MTRARRATLLMAYLLLVTTIPTSDARTPIAPTSDAGPPVASAPAPVGAGQQLEPGQAEPGYLWPLAGPPQVTRRFTPPAQRWLPGHRGVDLAATPGAVVRAAGPGVVYFAGPVAGRGVVSVDHGTGLRTTYEPVTALVSAGDPLTAGDPIGVLEPGHRGCPVEACLHWGLRQGDDYLDPLSLLGLGQVRLLPLTWSPRPEPMRGDCRLQA